MGDRSSIAIFGCGVLSGGRCSHVGRVGARSTAQHGSRKARAQPGDAGGRRGRLAGLSVAALAFPTMPFLIERGSNTIWAPARFSIPRQTSLRAAQDFGRVRHDRYHGGGSGLARTHADEHLRGGGPREVVTGTYLGVPGSGCVSKRNSPARRHAYSGTIARTAVPRPCKPTATMSTPPRAAARARMLLNP
jgi:hypothetical protein